MLEATDIIKERLRELAAEQTNPFCYGCYVTVKPDDEGNARCLKCGSA